MEICNTNSVEFQGRNIGTGRHVQSGRQTGRIPGSQKVRNRQHIISLENLKCTDRKPDVGVQSQAPVRR